MNVYGISFILYLPFCGGVSLRLRFFSFSKGHQGALHIRTQGQSQLRPSANGLNFTQLF